MRVLIICTGNTCRSQMAEGYLRKKYPNWEIYSAGTEPGLAVNPYAIKVMDEIGIDIRKQKPESVLKYIDKDFDYVITVCDEANEKCPTFTGKVKHRIHRGFYDPAQAVGTEQQILEVYREVRNQIIDFLDKLFNPKNQ